MARRVLAFTAAVLLCQPVHAAGTQVWLTSGEVYLILDNGERVVLTEGNYISCQDADWAEEPTNDRCKIIPLAAAPSAPTTILSSLGGGPAAAATGLAAAPLAASSATVIGSIIVPVIGAGVIAAGVAIGLTSNESTTSTNSTNR
ncbi:hypothetical protein KHP62_00225 [Rhodobacteraceae bacterium NNCM2]|nr:hypothetical protein [Coraliihabitans acroporae]